MFKLDHLTPRFLGEILSTIFRAELINFLVGHVILIYLYLFTAKGVQMRPALFYDLQGPKS